MEAFVSAALAEATEPAAKFEATVVAFDSAALAEATEPAARFEATVVAFV